MSCTATADDCPHCPACDGVCPGCQGFHENYGSGFVTVQNRDYPISFEALIDIDVETINKTVSVLFAKPRNIIPEPNIVSFIDIYPETLGNPKTYDPQLRFEKRPINDFSASGVIAEHGVPMVEEAIYLGNFNKDGGEWSAWLDVTKCYAQDITHIDSRIFTFSYTVFAYCNCNRHDDDCSCYRSSWKIGETKNVTFQL